MKFATVVLQYRRFCSSPYNLSLLCQKVCEYMASGGAFNNKWRKTKMYSFPIPIYFRNNKSQSN